MYHNLIVDNPKIITAKNNTKKCVVGIREIASSPHYYSGQELLCTRCGDRLTISTYDGRYYLKHLKSGGSKHYTCPLYTTGTTIHNVYYIKDTFLSGLEKNLNYCVVVSSNFASVYVTIPHIKKDILTEFRESKGKIAICCEGITYYVPSNKLSSSLPSFFELEKNLKVNKIRFYADGANSKIVTNWYYKDALFIYQKKEDLYYLNKITYEVNPNIKYAYFSDKPNEKIEGCIIKTIRKVKIDNEWKYLNSIKFSEYNKTIDEFLLEHDCSYSTEDRIRSNSYINILKGNYKTPVKMVKEDNSENEMDFEEENEQTKPNLTNNKLLGEYVHHKEYGRGYIKELYPKQQFIVNFNGRERIVEKEKLTFLGFSLELESQIEEVKEKKEKTYLGKTIKINGKIRINSSDKVEKKDIEIVNNNKSETKEIVEKKEKDYVIGEIVTIEGRRCVLKRVRNNKAEFETSTGKVYFIELIDGSVKKGFKEKFKKRK